MVQLPEPDSIAWPFLFTQPDRDDILLAVHASLPTRHDELGQLLRSRGNPGGAAHAVCHDLIAVDRAQRQQLWQSGRET